MPTLQIRDLPDDLYRAITVAARLEQRSLSQQAIVELRRALSVSSDGARAAVVQRLRGSDRRLPESAVAPEALLREARDTR